MDIKAFKMDGLGNCLLYTSDAADEGLGVDLFVSKDTANLTFLRKRQQPIIEVQKVNK